MISHITYAVPLVSYENRETNNDMYLTKIYLEEQLPQLASLDDYHKAVLLRNFVYVHANPDGWLTLDVPMTYEKFLQYSAGNIAPYCGSLAIEYVSLLSIYNIPSHYVHMTSDDTYSGKTLNDRHVVVEAYLNGRWVLQDPTFNVHWELDGIPLSTIELAKAFSSEKKPTPNSDGYPLTEKRVETYYMPYQELLAHLVITRYTVWGDEPCEGRLAIEMIYPLDDRVEEEEPERPVEGNHLFVYDFSNGVPIDWIVADPDTTMISVIDDLLLSNQKSKLFRSKFSISNAINVTALCRPYGYVLMTAMPIILEPGQYQMIVKGSIETGGIILSVLDIETDHFVQNTAYRYDNIKNGMPLVTSFTIKKKGQYHLILSNNATVYGEISKWTIEKIILQSINILI